MSKALIPLLLAFGLGLAVIIGDRMSRDAMAVVIGVAVGVAASVPTALLLVALLRRETRSYRAELPMSGPPAQLPAPNAIILDSAALAAQMQRQMAFTPTPLPQELQDTGGMRRLRVIGSADDEAEW
jgi:hypothetical protein